MLCESLLDSAFTSGRNHSGSLPLVAELDARETAATMTALPQGKACQLLVPRSAPTR